MRTVGRHARPRGRSVSGHLYMRAGRRRDTGGDCNSSRLSSIRQTANALCAQRRRDTDVGRQVGVFVAMVLLQHLLRLLDQVPAHPLLIESALRLVERRTVVGRHQLGRDPVNVVLPYRAGG